MKELIDQAAYTVVVVDETGHEVNVRVHDIQTHVTLVADHLDHYATYGLFPLCLALLILHENYRAASEGGLFRLPYVLLRAVAFVALFVGYGRVVGLITGVAGAGSGWMTIDDFGGRVGNVQEQLSQAWWSAGGIEGVAMFLGVFFVWALTVFCAFVAFVANLLLSKCQAILIMIFLAGGKTCIAVSLVPGVGLAKSWARALANVAAWSTVAAILVTNLLPNAGHKGASLIGASMATLDYMRLLSLAGGYLVYAVFTLAVPKITSSLFSGAASAAPGVMGALAAGWMGAKLTFDQGRGLGAKGIDFAKHFGDGPEAGGRGRFGGRGGGGRGGGGAGGEDRRSLKVNPARMREDGAAAQAVGADKQARPPGGKGGSSWPRNRGVGQSPGAPPAHDQPLFGNGPSGSRGAGAVPVAPAPRSSGAPARVPASIAQASSRSPSVPSSAGGSPRDSDGASSEWRTDEWRGRAAPAASPEEGTAGRAPDGPRGGAVLVSGSRAPAAVSGPPLRPSPGSDSVASVAGVAAGNGAETSGRAISVQAGPNPDRPSGPAADRPTGPAPGRAPAEPSRDAAPAARAPAARRADDPPTPPTGYSPALFDAAANDAPRVASPSPPVVVRAAPEDDRARRGPHVVRRQPPRPPVVVDPPPQRSREAEPINESEKETAS